MAISKKQFHYILFISLLVGTFLLRCLNSVPINLFGVAIDVLFGIFISLLTSHVFYFFVVFLPDEKKRAELNPYIYSRCKLLVSDAMSLIKNLDENKAVDLSIPIHKVKINSELLFSDKFILSKANFIVGNNTPPKYAAWIYYFYHQKIRTDQFISDVLRCSQFMDAHLIKILIEIENSEFMTLTKIVWDIHNKVLYADEATESQELKFFERSFVKYFEKIQQLDKFIITNYCPKDF